MLSNLIFPSPHSAKAEDHGERMIIHHGGGMAATVNVVTYLLAGQENVAMDAGSTLE